MSDQSHPFRDVPVVGAGPAAKPPRHQTVLSAEPADQLDALRAAVSAPDEPGRRAGLLRIVAEHPSLVEGWARLSELTLAAGDAVVAYAFARVAYHRGLDRLRREGWGGTGMVHWTEPSNRGFLRGLHALLAASAALDERDESSRCRAFLLELDPEDTLGVARYPETPGPTWTSPPLPE
ncbi:MAG: DUF3151 domain-containing protein [Candidatus Aeolococcus gillhamiae]|uniref:DUF3151 domain-containing protein n=1 Tax=Candidatus Aeolococcus gillhamiae TaxID=3127015 RepID=A0A2W6A3Z0_9BACT|nr:MAG: DUF3151 domain-containing protein [Candidatus Dormibacter sp. RRmetagenome_bin12]